MFNASWVVKYPYGIFKISQSQHKYIHEIVFHFVITITGGSLNIPIFSKFFKDWTCIITSISSKFILASSG